MLFLLFCYFNPRAQVSRVIGERAKRAKRYLVMSMESRDIYYKYSTLPRGISVYIALKVGLFPEAEGNILYRGCNICRHFTRVRVEYLVYYIGIIRSDVPIDHAQYQGWNIGVEDRYIFHPYGPI